MSMINTIEEQRKERDHEKILSYLREQDISSLLELIPNVFEFDIEEALREIIIENQILHVNQFGEIVQ